MTDSTTTIPSDELGLTPVHMAVLQDDIGQLFALINSREYGIDALDSRRATPIMLAAVAGRSTAFTYLLENGASRQKQDVEGLKVVDYLLSTEKTERLAQIYQPHAKKRFSERRRKLIRATLKAFGQANNQEKYDPAPAVPVVEPAAVIPAPAPVAAPVAAPVPGVEEAPITDLPETCDVIIHQDKVVMFGTFSVQCKAAFTMDLHNKTMGAIRGRAQGSPFHVMTISGWRGDKADLDGITVLNNSKYTLLVKDVTKMYGHPLYGNPLDCRFEGTPEEKLGVYNCCHSERQLATWLVEESIFHVLGTKSITVENVTKLREKLGILPADLRETVIELGHIPCQYCINYVKLLQKKSGLAMKLKSRAWFVTGKRKMLRRIEDRVFVKRCTDTSSELDFLNELGDDEIEDLIEKRSPTTRGIINEPQAQQKTSPIGLQKGNLARLLSKRARAEQKAVDTRKYRQGPAELTDPFEAADMSSDADDGYASSPLTLNAATSSVADGSDQLLPLPLPLPLMHKRRASVSSIIEVSSSSRASSSVTSDSEERENKRQRRLDNFKNVVIEFAHVSSDPPPESEQEPPEGFLENFTVTEPFPGATAFWN